MDAALANLATCCSCKRTLAPAPSRESESITVTPCSYTLPPHPDLPPADACIHYRKAVRLETRDYSYTETDGGSTYHETQTESYTNVFERAEAGEGACYQRELSSESHISNAVSNTPEGGGEGTSSSDELNVGSTLDGPCVGSQTHTDGDDSETTTDVSGLCYHPGLETPNSDWSYSSPGIYSISYPSSDSHGYDNQTYTITYTDPIDRAFVVAMLDGKNFPADVNGSESSSSVEPCEDCEDTECVESATKARYRIGLPSDWLDYATRHADWLAADPGTRGPEPEKHSTYDWKGEEWFFPAAWEAWKAESAAFAAATAAHDAWEDADPDTRGDEPDVPESPGPAPTPAPSKTASRSWNFSGGDEWSEWWEIAIPDEPGETRVIEQRARHYHSARLGSLWTRFGERAPD